MMSKTRILLFAADPRSAPPSGGAPRLRLDEEVRQIRQMVRAARHRDALEFDVRWAARTDDLLQALNETRPQVVHFSGHGGAEGLVFAGGDGTHPQPVAPSVLAELFRAFRGDLRLVVLSACHSDAQARGIADVVGCAIGTRGTFVDTAAITFNGAFYRAVAFGASVEAAFRQAVVAVEMDHGTGVERPELVVGAGVDASRVVLVPGGDPEPGVREAPTRLAKRARVAVAAVVLASGAIVGAKALVRDTPEPVRPLMGAPVSPAPASAQGDDALSAAKSLHAAGNHEEAFPLFLAAARSGSSEAMAWVGTAYLQGEGVAADTMRAIDWIRRAADRRDARGMNALGLAYLHGAGESRSTRWARHWFRAAAEEKGYAPAMRNLGHLHRESGTADGYAQAREWYRRAADAGSAEAVADLGLVAEMGWGGPADADEALRWYRAAAEGGSTAGMVAAGRMHERRGDFAAAREWYLRGAEAGSADAMNNLGVLHHRGRGVPRDRDQAIRWFRRAAESGSLVGAGNLRMLTGG